MNLVRNTAALLIVCASAAATEYTFQPTPTDLYDLDHYKAYRWGVNWSIPSGQTIQSAVITIKNIDNWRKEANILYVDLLNLSAGNTMGVRTYTDDQATGDYFAGKWSSVPIGTYTDLSVPNPENISFTLDSSLLAKLTTYASDGYFGLGFDPDCHFFNDGVKLTIVTGSRPPRVPDGGASLALMGIGLLGLAAMRRRLG